MVTNLARGITRGGSYTNLRKLRETGEEIWIFGFTSELPNLFCQLLQIAIYRFNVLPCVAV